MSTEVKRNQAYVGPVNAISIGLFFATGAGLYFYLENEKKKLAQRKQERKEAENIQVGKPRIGGPFELFDQNGKVVKDTDFLGKYMLIYFGFTHCPDVCPDELDKITEIIDKLDADSSTKDLVVPIFVTCDPQRDTPEVIKEYLTEFHPRYIGLTGDFPQVQKMTKAYRVYFSKPPKVQPGEDYLVDHSIFFYLMGPDGKFVDCYGKDRTADEASAVIKKHILEYSQN